MHKEHLIVAGLLALLVVVLVSALPAEIDLVDTMMELAHATQG